MSKLKQQFGQYMTSSLITDLMVRLITHSKSSEILEPSCGNGAFLQQLKNHNFTKITSCEIDKKIINPEFNVINTSFISYNPCQKFDVIIGNPPYIRWKNLEQNLKDELQNCDLWNKYCNSLCDYSTIFILKSVELLNDEGELIFITPEYWLSTTHAQSLRNYLLENGILTHIIRFNETTIFKGVTGSFIIFRFVKTQNKKGQIQITNCNYKKKLTQKVLDEIENHKNCDVFSIPQFNKNQTWILADTQTQEQITKYEKLCTLSNKTSCELLGDYCHIGNGMVSGLDKAFQLKDISKLNQEEKSNVIQVIKAKNINAYYPEKTVPYIFIKKQIDLSLLTQNFPCFYKQLSDYKDKLENRYNYNHPLNFWEWAFLRNYTLFTSNQDKIFVPCKERITNKDAFRFCYAQKEIFPTQDVAAIYKKDSTKEDLFYILALLNSKQVFTWLCHKGIRKGDIIEFSETPIASIPFRKIDFNNPKEVQLHNKIVSTTKNYISTPSKAFLDSIENYFNELLSLPEIYRSKV